MILLDTQVVLWTILDSPRLGDQTRRSMTKVRCYVSSVSIVEFRLKQMLGKLTLPSDLPRHLRAQGFESLDFTTSHAEGLAKFPQLAGHDPFDRMLVAQARVSSFDFVTSDSRLLALDQPWIIDATA